MHTERLWMALLAAGSLALGAGISLAATSESVEHSQKPEASKAITAPAPTESKQMKATPAEKETATDRIARGVVTAVEPSTNPSTLTLKVMRGKQEEIVGVDVPAGTKILAGKTAKTLADIKVGDRVWMKYDRMNDKLVADSIRLLKKPAKPAARKASAEKAAATPAASKTEGYK